MNYKSLLYISGIILYIIISNSCANIVSPTGGPRDSLPPVLVNISPNDSALHFTGNKITFSFNEYVQVQDVQNNLVVSPNPKINPTVDYKLRTVTVKLKDTLEKNTTYSINFGNAIRDVNEGNVLKDFTYIFTTGNTIDSNTLSGKVILAETGLADSTLIVILHRDGDDSAVIKERPRYYAKLDSSGHFHFRFLAPGTYYLYALKDEGNTKRYLSPAQLFAFADKRVNVGAGDSSITLFAYAETKEERKVTTTNSLSLIKPKKEEDNRLRFQTSLEGELQDILGDFQFKFENPLKTFDSSKIIFADEKFTPLATYTITPDSTNRIYSLHFPWKEATKYNLILDKDFASDSLGKKLLKTDTISFKTKKETDYGSIRLRFPTIDLQKKPVIQIIEGGKLIFSYTLTSKEFYTRLFNPGEYDIRILYDTNGNGVWDPGAFFGKHIQPERVQAVSKKLLVRGNWDNDVTVQLLSF